MSSSAKGNAHLTDAASGVRIEDAYPLSQLQQGMLYHSEMDAKSPLYHDIFRMTVGCRFEFSSFEHSVLAVVTRHPVLRTAFDMTNFDRPMQLVFRRATPDIRVDDIREMTSSEQLTRIEKWRAGEATTVFALHQAPLFRIRIFVLADDHFEFFFSFHHAIMDGWSLHSLVSELFLDYAGRLKLVDVLPSVPIRSTFKDFVARERQTLDSSDSRSFWEVFLRGAAATKIPTISDDDDTVQEGVGVSWREIPTSDLEKLRAIADEEQVPLRTVMLAIHVAVMKTLSNQNDVTTHVVMNGRLEEEDGDKVYGLFVNLVSFRYKMRDESWPDFLHNIFADEKRILPHRRFPLSEIRNFNGPATEANTAFDFRDFHVYRSIDDINGFEIVLGDYFEHTNYDLLVGFVNNSKDGSMRLQLRFAQNQFGAEEIYRIGQQYIDIISRLADSPAATVAHHCVPHDEEYKQLVCPATPLDAESYGNRALHEYITNFSKLTPKQVAVQDSTESISYQDLDGEANRLAQALRDANVLPGDIVGLAADRKIDLIVGLLGILKAGAAYLPLDVDAPHQRNTKMLVDADVSVVVADELGQRKLFDQSLQIIEPRQTQGCYLCDSPAIAVPSDSAAYVIYTSGSTGEPKGVLVPHRAAVNMAKAFESRLELSPDDSLLALARTSFDLSVMELFAPLLSGGTLLLAPTKSTRDGEALAGQIARLAPTIMVATPSTWRMLRDIGWTNKSVRWLLCGGEAFPLEMLPWFLQTNAKLANVYGPTETTVWSTFQQLHGAESIVPLGAGISNTNIYIVNEQLFPVPRGAIGEICIGGQGVANGYLGKPDLTAERFVPDPFCGTANQRMYRTGDLGRYMSDGRLEYCGRNDSQIKVRGYRIELQEIEDNLTAHALIRSAAVLTLGEVENDKALVACIEPIEKNTNLEPSELANFLRNRLPSYMIPSMFTTVTHMPINANGKVDRQVLHKLRGTLAQQSQPDSTTSMTTNERQVAEIWQNALNVENLTADSDFFTSGGHSLAALAVTFRIRKSFGVEVPVGILLEHRTVRAFAKAIEALGSGKAVKEPMLVQMKSGGDPPPLFLIHPMGGHVFCYEELVRRLRSPVFAFRSTINNLKPSIAELAREYVNEILHVQKSGPYLLGGWCMGATVALEIACQMEDLGYDVSEIFVISASAIESIDPRIVESEDALIAQVFAANVQLDKRKLSSLATADSKIRYALQQAQVSSQMRDDIEDLPHASSLLTIYKNNAKILSEHTNRRYSGEICVLRAADEVFSGAELDDLGWQQHAVEGATSNVITGNHTTVLDPPNVDEIAEHMERRLQKYRSSSPTKIFA